MFRFRVNVTDILEFFPSDDSNRVRFIWASEESGWRHLYLVTAQICTAAQDIPLEGYSECEHSHLEPFSSFYLI
jgi:hypothetical protein